LTGAHILIKSNPDAQKGQY